MCNSLQCRVKHPLRYSTIGAATTARKQAKYNIGIPQLQQLGWKALPSMIIKHASKVPSISLSLTPCRLVHPQNENQNTYQKHICYSH